MSLPTNPINRKEFYLNAIATGNTADMPAKPQTREEAYLDYIAKHGGGSGGAENYAQLDGKPQINNVELASGNNSLSALGIQGKLTFDNVPTDGSNNPVKSDGIYDSEKDIYAVMGEMGAKNLVTSPYDHKSKTLNNVTFTVNDDGSITIVTGENGATANTTFSIQTRASGKIMLKKGKYICSGCPSGGGSGKYVLIGGNTNVSPNVLFTDSGNGVNVTITADELPVGMWITIYSGCIIGDPITFKPMLRLASDTDDTYQRYAKTNKQLTDDVATNTSAIEAMVNGYGSKNLAPNNASTTEMSPVTFTVNSDKTVTVNRTGNHTGWRTLVLSENVNLKAGTYILSSGYTGDEQYNVYFELADYSSGSPVSVAKTDLSDVVTFTIQTDITNGKFQIPVRPGNSVFSDITIKPMIRDARITDPTYVPYAMTNEQLTERVVKRIAVPITVDSNNMFTISNLEIGYNTLVISANAYINNRPIMYFVGYNNDGHTATIEGKVFMSDCVTPGGAGEQFPINIYICKLI